MARNNSAIDMTRGPILSKLLAFVFPLLCTYVLQSLFNAADMVIVGRFCSHEALAAIGATLNPITLMLKIFIGLSTGANAVIALYHGARDPVRFHRATHTAMALSIYGGLIMTVVALVITKPLLVWMKTPADILNASCVYTWLYFLGIPFLMIFNFGCALLRGIGDSKRPMMYLLLAGAVNVLLNLFFVLVCRMTVAGVAIATTLSNALAAALILRTLVCATDHAHISWKKLRFHWQLLKEILWIGIPAAFCSSFYNVANIVIQTSLNTFGALAIAGCAAASTVESFVSLVSMAFQQAAMTLVAQNYGAKNYPRVARGCVLSLLVSSGLSFVLGMGIYLNGPTVLAIFNRNPDVIQWGMVKMRIMLTLLFLGCLMDISTGCLRGLGRSMVPAFASFLGACVFRIFWVLRIYPLHPTMTMLMSCYPISWILILVFNGTMLWVILKKLFRKSQS